MGDNRNMFVGTGLVDNYTTGTTGRGDQVCSFTLNMTEMGRQSWVRCNVYGLLADYCIKNVKEKSEVFVSGKIMNRRTRDKQLAFTEIRCQDVLLLNEPYNE